MNLKLNCLLPLLTEKQFYRVVAVTFHFLNSAGPWFAFFLTMKNAKVPLCKVSNLLMITKFKKRDTKTMSHLTLKIVPLF